MTHFFSPRRICNKLSPSNIVNILHTASLLDHTMDHDVLDFLLTQVRSATSADAATSSPAAAAAASSSSSSTAAASQPRPASSSSAARSTSSSSSQEAAGSSGRLDAVQYVALISALAKQNYRPRAALMSLIMDSLLTHMGELDQQVCVRAKSGAWLTLWSIHMLIQCLETLCDT